MLLASGILEDARPIRVQIEDVRPPIKVHTQVHVACDRGLFPLSYIATIATIDSKITNVDPNAPKS